MHYEGLTNAGLALLSKILANKGIPNFYKAECGVGKPDKPEDIKNMTVLVDMCHGMVMKKSFVESATVRMSVLLDNADVAQAFDMTEYGIYLRNDVTGEEALYFYAYDDNGDYIPVGRVLRKYVEREIDTEIIAGECEIVPLNDNGVYLTPHDLDDHDIDPTAHSGLRFVELSSADTPPQGTRLHIKILRAVTGWVTPYLSDSGFDSGTSLNALLMGDAGNTHASMGMLNNSDIVGMRLQVGDI